MVRLPDGRLHLISAITPQKPVSTPSTASVSQTLPAAPSTPRPAGAPNTLLIGGQRYLLSNMPGGQVLLTPGSVAGQKVVSGMSSRPQLLLTTPSQSTMIRMSSGQHMILRPTPPGAAMTTLPSSTSVGLTTNRGLFAATGKSPPSSSYSVTPEVVQQGNLYSLLVACVLIGSADAQWLRQRTWEPSKLSFNSRGYSYETQKLSTGPTFPVFRISSPRDKIHCSAMW